MTLTLKYISYPKLCRLIQGLHHQFKIRRLTIKIIIYIITMVPNIVYNNLNYIH